VNVVSPLLGPILASTARTPGHAVTKLPTAPAFALLWTSALFRCLRRGLTGVLAWRPTRFASLRTAKRTVLEHPAFYTGMPCSVHSLLPPSEASLRTLSTGPVDSPEHAPIFVVHGGLLVARGKETVWDNSLYSTTGRLLTTVWLPLCCPSALFQTARFCALLSRVNFLLHRRGQKATSLANRGSIPIAGQLETILTYWRIGAPISHTASLFANTPPHFQAISF
jgi:hypothetical protein